MALFKCSKCGGTKEVDDLSKVTFCTHCGAKNDAAERININIGVAGNSSALLDRGFMALEDKEWEKADGFFEQILNFDAKCSEAYLGKLLAELKVSKKEELLNQSKPFDSSANYQKIIRFGNDVLKSELEGYISVIKERKKQKHKKRKKIIIPLTSFVALLIVFVSLINTLIIPSVKYNKAEKLVSQNKYDEAIEIYVELDSFKDSGEKILETRYKKAEELISQGKYDGAIEIYIELDGFKDSTTLMRKYYPKTSFINKISAGSGHTVGLKSDGTIVAVGLNSYGQCNVSGWDDIVAISARYWHTVGLKSDGTIVAVGLNSYGQCNVSGWDDIVAISAGGGHTVGLKSDGTVVAVGWNNDGQCDVSGWDLF